MKVTLKYGGNVVELPDPAALSMIQQGHATATREAVEPVVIAAAAENMRKRLKIREDGEREAREAIEPIILREALAIRQARIDAAAESPITIDFSAVLSGKQESNQGPTQ